MVSTELTERRSPPFRPTSSLASAAAELFAAFADEPVPDVVEHCPHCVSPQELEALRRPVASLPPDLVTRFVRKAGTTWGTPADLRRITPRVLTLSADHRLGVSRALVWHQLRRAGWTDWPSHQSDAIRAFIAAEFSRLLGNDPRPSHTAHRWLGATAAGLDDLRPLLTIWNDSIGPLPEPEVRTAAVAHLVELLTTSPLRPDLPDTVTDLFPENPAVAPQLTTFLIGPGTDLDLRRAAEQLVGTSGSRRVNVAVERLRRFRDAVARSAGSGGIAGSGGPD